jgi:hypothetical protein
MKVFEETYGSLEFDPSVPCVVATFVGFMTSDQFRQFLMRGLDLMIEKKKKQERFSGLPTRQSIRCSQTKIPNGWPMFGTLELLSTGSSTSHLFCPKMHSVPVR